MGRIIASAAFAWLVLPGLGLIFACRAGSGAEGPDERQLESPQYWLRRAAADTEKLDEPRERLELWYGVLGFAARLGDAALLDELALRARVQCPDTEALALSARIAKVLADAGRFEAAIRAAEQITDLKRRTATVVEIAVEEARQGRAEEAKGLVSSLPQDAQAPAYAEVARALAYKDFPAAMEVMQSLPADQRRRFSPHDFLYAGMGSNRIDSLNRAASLALESIEREDEPVRKALEYASIAEVVARAADAKKLDAAIRQRVSAAIRALSAQTDDFRARERLVDAFLALGEFDDAQKVIAGINREDARAGLIGKVAIALAQKGRFEEALAIAESGQLDRGAARANQSRYRVYGEIALAKAQAGDFARAEALADKLPPHYSGRDTLLEGIASRRIAAGDIKGAIATGAELGKKWMQVHVYISAGNHESDGGRPDHARRLFTEAASLAATIEDESTRSQVLQYLASSQVKSGDLERASETARSIPDATYRHIPFRSIAEEYLKRGDGEAFNRAAAAAMEAASRTTGNTEGAGATYCAAVALLYHTAGCGGEFRKALQQAIRGAANAEGPFWKFPAYGSIALAYQKANAMREWAAIVNRIQPPLDHAVACMVTAGVLRKDLLISR